VHYSPSCSGVAQVGQLVRITFNEQLVFFYELVKTEDSRSLTSDVLGQAFGIELLFSKDITRQQNSGFVLTSILILIQCALDLRIGVSYVRIIKLGVHGPMGSACR
jgi:hypothetical protein